MASDESIQADGSTARRQGDASVDQPAPRSNLESDPQETPELEQAKTVIRGSSVAMQNAKRADRMNRSPVAIAKVLLEQHLNHFYLEELVGGGGMGAVFRAHDDQLDREVAIKVIPFVGDDPDLQRRFRNEAQSAAKLDHPRIARVFDVGSQDDWYYIVFEYIRGTNIRDLVAGVGPLAVDDAVFYTCQVAEALQHAADRGIVHRDIKPSNVLVGQDGSIKLVDMGLARSDRMEMGAEDETASGVTLGTFDYISPEQAQDPRAADLRSDIYSLGCTLFFMLTCQPPYPGGTMLQKLLAHGSSPPPDARLQRNEVSYELSAIIQKMLAKSPDDRYETANDLIADFRELAFREGLARSQGVNAVSVSEPSRLALWLERNAPWIAAATLLLVTVGWMQLFGSTRDEFLLKRPPSVTNAQQIPLDISSPTPSAIDSTGNPSNSAGIPGLDTDVPEKYGSPLTSPTLQTDPRNLDSAPSSQSAAFLGSPIPDEPGSALPLDRSADESVGAERVKMADPRSDEPGDQPPTLFASPRLVRVVGPDAEIDLTGDAVPRDIDGAAMARSLKQALEYAQRYDQIELIEIATPVFSSEPIVIPRDGLKIMSTVVGGTKVVFQSPRMLAMERTRMISLGSFKTYFEGLHFVWDVPRTNLDGGAMIALNANKMVQLTDCSITVRNPASRADVCAFEVITNPDDGASYDVFGEPIESSPDSQNLDDDQLPLVAIQLYNVIVRGQMTMIQMDFAAALQLQWDNGLLAVSQRMIETGGARIEPSPKYNPILLQLTELTAHAPLGIMQMRLGSKGRYPVAIDREANHCVFMVDTGVPHFEVTGLGSVADNTNLVEFDGDSNVYEVDDTMLDPMVILMDTQGESQSTLVTDLAIVAPSWFDEKSPLWSVWWSSNRFAETPPDQLTPKDYRQEGAVFSGFDEKALPPLPAQDDKRILDTQFGNDSLDKNSATNAEDSRP